MHFLSTIMRLFNRFWHGFVLGKHLPVYMGLIVTYIVLTLFSTNQLLVRNLRDRLDNMVYDFRFNLAPVATRNPEFNIVIVDYDERSLGAEGQWPWSRFKIGEMVSRLAEYGVLVVGFDVYFPEYERNLVRELEQRVELDPDYAPATGDLLGQLDDMRDLLDGDLYFAESMQATDVVLGFSFRPAEAVRSGVLPAEIFSIAQTDTEVISLNEMQGYVGNVDILQNGARGAGFFDTVPDIDGVIRRSPLFMKYRNRIYPSLALEMARLYYFEDQFSFDIDGAENSSFRELQGIYVGKVRIPTDEQGRVLVPFVGPARSYTYISATDVLRGTLTPAEQEQLFNSMVLIGTTSTGLYDLRATPVQAVYPGVEVHANILNAILSSAPSVVIDEASAAAVDGTFSGLASALSSSRQSPFPTRPDWQAGAVMSAIIVVGIALSLIYPYLGPGLLALSSITFMIGLAVLNFQLWSTYKLDISLIALLLLILLITVVNLTYGFLKEGLTKKAIKGMFDQYVPPAHINAMLDNPEKYNFAGESKELSILFTDIRGFTSISEKLTAAELKNMLNDFFTPLTAIIFEHNGTIDKYVGDMIMAFWGAPLDDPNHRVHAVQAALRMLAKVEELQPVFKARGLDEVRIGAGINSGVVSVGDMGSTYRRSYTVLGDAVNLASRLESITKTYGVRFLIGEDTFRKLDGFLCRRVDKVQVKGKEESICIYQPLCEESAATDGLRELVDEYHRAYDYYLAQRWNEAETLFRWLQQIDPDTQLYSIYLQRIPTLREQQLPADWDGTYRHTSK